MIKKLILIATVCLFGAGSIINMHLAQNDHNTDISLADISVMAQADGESEMFCCFCTGEYNKPYGYIAHVPSRSECIATCQYVFYWDPFTWGEWHC